MVVGKYRQPQKAIICKGYSTSQKVNSATFYRKFKHFKFKAFNLAVNSAMKFLLFTILLVSTTALRAADTLRHYVAGQLWTSTYSTATYPKQIARFEPQCPATVKSIIVTLSGKTGGTALVRMFGHESGTVHPQLQADAIPPTTITKTTDADNERIEITLATPVRIENNQFFIAVSNMVNTNLRVGMKALQPSCSAGAQTGGEFLFSTAENAQGQWALQHARAYAIDIVLDYDPLPPQPFFIDVDAQAGINSGGQTGGNIAVGNANHDSHLDLLMGKRLYKNNGGGTFTNISTTAGIDYAPNPAANMFIDMNNDGWDDILFLSHNPTQNYLYTNNGNNTFTKQQLSGLPNFQSITSFSIADINTDGFPDIFIGQLWQPYGTPLPNFLLINDGKLGFTNETNRLGAHNIGFSRGSQWVDFDNDGDLDLFVANYAASLDRPTSYDNFFRNKGDGTFENIISQTPIDNNNGSLFYNMSTGCDWADYDNDGDMDLLHSNFSHPRNMPPVQYTVPWGPGGSNIVVKEDTRMTTLFQNQGAPNYTFKDLVGQVSQSAGQISAIGLQHEETHANAAFGDLNNDGLMDIITTTYYPCNFNDIYIQQPNNTFKLQSYHYGLNKTNGGENPTFVDYDNDGKLDVLIGHGGNFNFFKNNALHGGNFVSIELSATTGNKNAIGSRVYVWAGGKCYVQDVNAGRGIRSQKPCRLFFGLGKNTKIDSAVVRWYGTPATERFSNITLNTLNYLTQGGNVSLSAPQPELPQVQISISPNPFSSQVNFSLNLPQTQPVQLQIFDALGRQVYSASHTFAHGQHSLQWQPQVAQGIYTYKLQTGQTLHTGTLVKQ